MFWHDLALALGRTVGELMEMSVKETRNWWRYIRIRGPIGEKRLDDHLDLLRLALTRPHDGDATFEDCRLKYSYKNHRPKEEEGIDSIETTLLENLEKDMAFLESRFGGKRRQTADGG